MLNNQHYYHRIIRKMVIAFGTMFNNIRLVRYDKAGTTEIERIIVPLSYADKEKFYKRITQDPELTKETAITLPRMGFVLDSITYDPLRKTSLFNSSFAANPTTGDLQTTKVAPYNFNFTLSIYVRNVEDGTQIVEQILPYFNPDYTLSMQLTNVPSIKNEVPIILESVNQNTQADGVPDNTRVIVWDLTFTMKGYFYGAVSNGKMIRTVTANTFYYNTDDASAKEIHLTDGIGSYKIGEMVYEGYKVGQANATGYVESWSDTSNTLIIVDTSGILKTGRILHGAVSGAAWNISSMTSDHQLVNIQVTPDPLTANANDDFGYTTTITEYI
jgi:hypothetical protein